MSVSKADDDVLVLIIWKLCLEIEHIIAIPHPTKFLYIKVEFKMNHNE